VNFKVLACDYDGTLASEDRIGAEALAALGQAREAGMRLVLVTGRTFFDLLRVCEPLDLFDAVVAENGGVLYSPATGIIREQGPPPSPRLLAELDRRGISFQVGRVIIGTARADEEAVRATLAATWVNLDLVYNRGALMLLPKGVSKGAGVRQVIRSLGLSFHDVLAFGDAENDVDLFEACGWTGCPADAVPALKERADWVFPGEDGTAIARAIAGPILKNLLPPAHSPRQRIEIGWASGTSEAVTLPAKGVNVLIVGDPLSGKSCLAGVFVERLLDRQYAVCVIDPEGDYRVLARLPGVTWVEIREAAAVGGALRHFERDPSACVVADLSTLLHAKKVQVIESILSLIRRFRRRLGLPHWVVLDEAHYSLHREGVSDHALGLADKGFCLATYRSSWLRESVMKAADVFVLSRTTAHEELVFLRSWIAESSSDDEGAVSVLPNLPLGQFLMIQPEGPGARSALTFVAMPRETLHVRHLKKYADSRVSPERRFIFRRPDGSIVATADSVNAFRRAVATVEERVLAYHAERGDFSRWVGDVFADKAVESQLRKTETRWNSGEISDLRTAIERLIAAHYGEDR